MTAPIRWIVPCLGALVAATAVSAADTWPSELQEVPRPPPNPFGYAWHDPRLVSGIGVGVTVGGGVTGFTDGSMRDVISNPVAASWNARVSVGTHIPIGGELNYFGSGAQVVTLSDQDNGFLIGTTLEAVLRWTILPLASGTPYVFGGAGWQHYDVQDPDFPLADSGMRGSDNVASFPLGAGMSYRDPTGWTGDVRATFRFTSTSDLLIQPSGEGTSLDSWEATAAVGYEF